MNATAEELEREYDPLEDPIYVHWPIWLSITAILLDRALAVILWAFESNPIVTQMGIPSWLLLTFVLITGMLYAWYPAMGVRNDIVRALTYGIAIAHVSMVFINLAVVILP